MPTTTQLVRYATWYSSDRPNNNYFGKTGYLSIDNSPVHQGLIYFPSPFTAAGANVTSAELQLKTRALPAGTYTLSVQLVNRGLQFGSATYNRRPTLLRGPVVTLTKIGPLAADTVWEFDVAAIMQTVADGGTFYGFRISTSSTNQVLVQGNMSARQNPKLITTWTVAPTPPDALAPSAGRVVGVPKPTLRWSFYDHAGDEDLQAVQVQTSTSAAFTTVAWDSGVVPSTAPTLDLNSPPAPAPTFTAPASGVTTYWRVRNQNGGGLWSAWSTPTSWVYRAQPSLTMVNPNPGSPYVTDPTPPIDWQYSSPTGSPQARWRTGLYKLDARGRRTLLDYSNVQIGAATSWTPTKAITTAGTYRIVVDVWDSYNREATPGDGGFASVYQDFTFQPTATVVAPNSLVAVSNWPAAEVYLTWQRAEQPDFWLITRDGENLDRHPGSTLVKGTAPSYGITDHVPANGTHTWAVYAIVNGKASAAATVTAQAEHVGTWLIDQDTYAKVCLQNDTDHSALTMPEVVAVHEPLGSPTVVLVTEALRGYEGALTGGLYAGKGMPANQTPALWRQRLLEWKGRPGTRLRLLIEDLSFPVAVKNVQVKGDPDRPGEWLASFEFYQEDEFIYDTNGLGDL